MSGNKGSDNKENVRKGRAVMLTVKPPPKSSEGGLEAGVRAELTVLGM